MTDGIEPPIRIAMWSGPRNLSTALMRSFGNRPDTAVVDEPFYAAFLAATGADHPMRGEVLARHQTDWGIVAAELSGPPPLGRRIFYQKHMTHHMIPAIGRGWMRACRHAFLIRRPERVLASYAAKRQTVEFADLGFAEQEELFDEATDIAAAPPPVIDADALLADPPRILAGLCDALRIPFSRSMLSWPPGPRPTDGAWAPHWYEAVNNSTGFAAAATNPPVLADPKLIAIAARALPIYRRLAAQAIT